jgi:5'-nucleotidase
MENIVISNQEKLDKAKREIQQQGAEKLHILADFDRTLTKAFVDGKPISSLLWLLYNGKYLSEDYAKKAQDLHDKYHSIETDPKTPKEEKRKAMEEWWEKHFDLLVKSGLNKKDIKAVIESDKVKLRDGSNDFFELLKEKNIPLVIMSSSGLGEEGISMYLSRANKLYNNIYIISNSFVWDESGGVVAVKKPIIHGMNKDETMVKSFPDIYKKIENRKNVILLGDNPEDIGMVEGFDCENIIKIGFLNDKTEEKLESYKKYFDIVILNDGPMDFINDLLKEISK